MSQIIIAPSILAADFGNLTSEIKEVEKYGVPYLHIDVMDGRFVPPITFGDNMVATARRASKLFLEAHLMVVHPEEQFESFHKAGADRVIIHQETCPHLHRTLTGIRDLGMKNGVAINPGTPIETVFDVLDVTDLVLVMTVNPGWGGQKFISECLSKIRALKSELTRRNLSVPIEVDGGINDSTARECIKAGATVLVAGSYIFGAKDRKRAIESLLAAS